MQELLRQCFGQFLCQLVEEKLIGGQAIFIDGTKIEANANKFTFTWEKSIEKYHTSLIEKSNELYKQLVTEQVLPAMEKRMKNNYHLKN